MHTCALWLVLVRLEVHLLNVCNGSVFSLFGSTVAVVWLWLAGWLAGPWHNGSANGWASPSPQCPIVAITVPSLRSNARVQNTSDCGRQRGGEESSHCGNGSLKSQQMLLKICSSQPSQDIHHTLHTIQLTTHFLPQYWHTLQLTTHRQTRIGQSALSWGWCCINVRKFVFVYTRKTSRW